MSREEDLIRSATHAIAATVREVPPLQLEPATAGLRRQARAPRRGRGRPRHWWSWGAPLTAAAVVVALAIALVLVKDIPNGSAVPGNAATSTAGPGGAVPRYYLALKQFAGSLNNGNLRYGIVAGDSLTGKTLATFAPPARTTFQMVTAAADDRTFVVFAVTSSNGIFQYQPGDSATLTGSWYEVRLAPGTAHPARLIPLPVKPWSWALRGSGTPGQVVAMALSQSGRELAVAGIPDVPDVPAAKKQPSDWQEVKVFSVATGRLLHDWTGYDASARYSYGDWQALSLTWIDGDRALAFATTSGLPLSLTIRSLRVAGPASGNLMADSTVLWDGTVLWSGTRPQGSSAACLWAGSYEMPLIISADGRTVSCGDFGFGVPPGHGHLRFDTDPLPAGTAAGLKPKMDYQVSMPPSAKGTVSGTPVMDSPLWVSPSGDTLIAAWFLPAANGPAVVHIGVISRGTFTPLRFPSDISLGMFAMLGMTKLATAITF